MALTEHTSLDQVEIVGEYKAVQIRMVTVVKKDGVEISRSYDRHVLHPDYDIANEIEEVKNICNAVWTDEVKSAWSDLRKQSTFYND